MLTEYYHAARYGAAVAGMDGFGVLKLSGSERASWLQGMVTNDVQKLGPGRGCYAAHLTPQGKIVAHMHVLAGEDALWLSMEQTALPKLQQAFDKLLITEDVQIEDCSGQIAILALTGPRSVAAIEAWVSGPVNLEGMYSHERFEEGRVVITDLGYELWVSRAQEDDAAQTLVQAGATAIDNDAWNVLRVEAGVPLYGVDIDETTTMPEIGEKGISYNKGCYIGQEVVARVKYLGHVNRRFVGLVLSGNEVPHAKAPIYRGAKEVGAVTSSVLSPGLDRVIALGFVGRNSYEAGTEVEIAGEGKRFPAQVVDLPFKV